MSDNEDPIVQPRPLRRSLDSTRAVVVERLQDAFATDLLEMDELDERLELAENARRPEDLEVLVADLPGDAPLAVVEPSSPGTPAASTALVPSSGTQTIRAIFGGTEREGRWSPPARINATAIFGGVELDFREATLAPGSVTHVHCNAFFGGVEIEVPTNVRVEAHGSGIFGGFSGRDHQPDEDNPPVIRVTGRAVFGGVEVKVRGEKRKSRRKRDRGHKRDRHKRLDDD